MIAPPFLHIPAVQELLNNKNIHIAAQNSSSFGYGAYTGEISSLHIKDIGVNWVILGHSERRSILNESVEIVADKAKLALKNKLKVIFCFGEKLEDRKGNKTQDIIKEQLVPFIEKVKELVNLGEVNWEKDIVLAYEPVWAIGTGVNATPAQAEEACAFIREILKQSVTNADNVRIIYGGSVTEKNTNELINQKNVDGFLVGGASIKPAFHDIVSGSKK